jgi:acetyl/propionyl-CoA carboxylase alpha subunit/acetyl-CoA carboxylase carboxyltransferase component
MGFNRLLIANRGEIAIRIAAAAAEIGLPTVAIHAEDDAGSLHCIRADAAVVLRGTGAAAYLDIAQIIAVARDQGCDVVHPGYGFLAENAQFAKACAEAGITFIGPAADVLALFADKASARRLAIDAGVPVIDGSDGEVTLAGAQAFFAALEPGAAMMIKAVAGGGGRGMRVVRAAGDIADAFAAASAEAQQAFGNGGLFVERFMAAARHIEIQIVADAHGQVGHLGERECSLQRRNQKLIEIAPAPGVTPVLRARIAQAAMRLAQGAGYRNIGTFEFLVDAAQLRDNPDDAAFYFMEANPRIQVEHTVTEEVTGIDLVQTQIALAGGASLAELGLSAPPARYNGYAIQMRINLETMDADGAARPSAGVIERYEMPSGRGIRVDGYGYAGYRAGLRYDSLLAKVIVHAPGDFPSALAKARRVIGQCRMSGVDTNIPFLRVMLDRPEIAAAAFDTRFVDREIDGLYLAAAAFASDGNAVTAHQPDHGPSTQLRWQPTPGRIIVNAPMQGLVTEVAVQEGDDVTQGDMLVILEAMKMVHPVTAPASGRITRLALAVGDIAADGAAIIEIDVEARLDAEVYKAEAEIDLDFIRPDLLEIEERRKLGLDSARSEAVARRHSRGHRTARENIADLCDDDSFVEYGALAIAAQSRRRSEDDLIRNTPADGIVTGTARINGALFGEGAGRCAVLAYDYMTLAGTQGHRTHAKMDRLFNIAERQRLPVVLFSEGGGGRPGDIDVQPVTGLDVASFRIFARMSGLVPLIGINAGRCFAGNAALLGCCDVIIATRDSSIGMSGPAMIEGGGLGVVHPDDVGPSAVQNANGVIDILVEDEAEAVRVAKQYLGYFQGRVATWEVHDQRHLRHALPEDRTRTYDVRALIALLADKDSVLELRRGFGLGVVTALARIEGRPVGIIANNPMHLGGAIDGPAADKIARFMQLLDAHDIPMLSLCDTPGFMVGPESEKTATVRRFGRVFTTAGGIDIPVMAIVLRKAYGLGAMSMLGGQSHVPNFTVSWPTGEFGGMGLEGAVRLGLRKELEAISDDDEREAYFRKQVAAAYRYGRAGNAASHFELDDVIDPADSRRWIIAGLEAGPARPLRSGKKRSHIDSW